MNNCFTESWKYNYHSFPSESLTLIPEVGICRVIDSGKLYLYGLITIVPSENMVSCKAYLNDILLQSSKNKSLVDFVTVNKSSTQRLEHGVLPEGILPNTIHEYYISFTDEADISSASIKFNFNDRSASMPSNSDIIESIHLGKPRKIYLLA